MRVLGIGLAILAAVSLQPTPDSVAVASIRDVYRRVERALPSYPRVRHDLHDFSLEGGYLDAWFDGPHVKKLEAMYFRETGRNVEDYYFADDTLVFMYASTGDYDRPLSGHVVRRDEHRFYFRAGQLIRWVDSTKAFHSTTSNGAVDRVRDVQQTVRLLLACANAPAADSAACTAR